MLGTHAPLVRSSPQLPYARHKRKRGGSTMWLSLFSIVTGIALGLGVGAVVLESQEENVRS
jgi:hypothetical protein